MSRIYSSSTAGHSATGTGLVFAKMTHLGMNSGGMDLSYSVADKNLRVHLCVGEESNKVLVTGTTPMSRQGAVLNAIDSLKKWAQNITLWMIAEKNGVVIARTAPVNYLTHVRPFYGSLTTSAIAGDDPPMKYSRQREGPPAVVPDEWKVSLFHEWREVGNRRAESGNRLPTYPMALLEIKYLVVLNNRLYHRIARSGRAICGG